MRNVILIVDDDTQNRKLFRDLLQIKGYHTLEAVNGQQGVELAKSKEPDLILMDVQMPVMSGLEATKILKADDDTKNIPILSVTAYAMKGDEEKIREAGFDGYITKPVDIKEFLTTIAKYLPERLKQGDKK